MLASWDGQQDFVAKFAVRHIKLCIFQKQLASAPVAWSLIDGRMVVTQGQMCA